MRDYAEVKLETIQEAQLLIAALRALDAPVLLLDSQDKIFSATSSAEYMLGLDSSGLLSQPWAKVWSTVALDASPLVAEPHRYVLKRSGRIIPVRAWRRPIGDAGLTIIGLHDLSDEEERDREVARILNDLNEQTDDLFAMYQITQFLNNEQDLSQLCIHFLHELERITGSDSACLYLVTPHGTLQPEVWDGLRVPPPTQPDIESAREWLQAQRTDTNKQKGSPDLAIFALPLMAEERLVGLAILSRRGETGQRERFLQTIGKEMGTALRAMQGRQALLAQEQKLEAIVDSTTDLIIQVGPDLQVRHFNPAAERLTGHRSEDALARSCADVLGCKSEPASSGCKGECPFAHVLATQVPIPYAEIEVVRRGERRYLAASVAPLNPGRGQEAAAVGILRDMSKQKQIEQLKDGFLITVSHQLRTPVALLRGYVDTLLHLKLSKQEQMNCITGIGDTASRLEHLVGQILDVTRIEDGRFDLHREPVRVVDIVRQAINALPHTAFRSRIWTELEPDLPLIYVDPQRFEEVITNLLDNSFKYSSLTGPVIIRAARRANSGERLEVMVQVTDEGIGIPLEEQASVFQKFQRGSNAHNLQSTGTGLGLFICRSIVEAHGGRIYLSSTLDSGTSVTLWLPAIERSPENANDSAGRR